jgi:hypothetical protein
MRQVDAESRFSRYPLMYSVLVLPLSAVRWMTFYQANHGGGMPISAAATFGVIAIYELSGAFNVILLFTTRSDVLLFHRKQRPQQPNDNDSALGRLPHILTPTCPHCNAHMSITTLPDVPSHGSHPDTYDRQQRPNGQVPTAAPVQV